jgi:hypothetical protein
MSAGLKGKLDHSFRSGSLGFPSCWKLAKSGSRSSATHEERRAKPDCTHIGYGAADGLVEARADGCMLPAFRIALCQVLHQLKNRGQIGRCNRRQSNSCCKFAGKKHAAPPYKLVRTVIILNRLRWRVRVDCDESYSPLVIPAHSREARTSTAPADLQRDGERSTARQTHRVSDLSRFTSRKS